MTETATQRAQIRAHLEAGRSITPLEALDLYGCYRLGARIHELKGEGLSILSERPEVNTVSETLQVDEPAAGQLVRYRAYLVLGPPPGNRT